METSVEADLAAIEAVVRDYFEGWFTGDVTRMKRALHPKLAKRAVGGDARWWGEGSDADQEALDETSAEWLIDATEAGLGRERARTVGGDTRVEVEIEDVNDTIANVTVRSAVYREYVHLLRVRDGWKIVNTVWQRV
jgi:hypothetical protein